MISYAVAAYTLLLRNNLASKSSNWIAFFTPNRSLAAMT